MSNFFIIEFNNDLTERLNQLNLSEKMLAQEIFDRHINSFLSTVNKRASLKKYDSRYIKN